MINNKLAKDEGFLYESAIQFGNIKGKAVITTENLILYKEKGLFTKKLRIDKKIPMSDIKMYKDNVLMKQNNNKLTLQTNRGDVSFECKNIFDANKLSNKIKDVRTDTNIVDRIFKKINKFKNSEVGNTIINGVKDEIDKRL